MKQWILAAILLGATPVALTTGTQAAPQNIKALKWPTFRQTSSKKSIPEVAAIQYLLRARGFTNDKPDGIFGARTAISVRAFQRMNGLTADGIVGAQTFPSLIKKIKRGDRGDAVRALQVLLNNIIAQSEVHGDRPIKLDGVFQIETDSMLRFHQSLTSDFTDSRMHLKEDGIANPRTWWVLFVNH